MSDIETATVEEQPAVTETLSGAERQEMLNNSDINFPSGTDRTGIENQSQLLQRHQSEVASQDYAIVYNFTRATPVQTVNTSTTVRSNQSEQRLRIQTSAPGRTIDQYISGGTLWTKQNVTGTVNYMSRQLNNSYKLTHQRQARPGELLRTIIQTGNYTGSNVTQGENGPLIKYTAESPSNNLTGQLPEDVKRVRGEIKIDQQGRVREASILIAGSTQGQQVVLFQQYTLLNKETVAVSVPEWISTVR